MVNKLKIHPLASVDSQLLYQWHEPLESDVILDAVINAVEPAGLKAEDCVRLETSTDEDVFVLCGDLLVSVTQSVPFSEDDYLQVALDTFSFENSLKGAPSIDESITACTHISVQLDTPASEEAPEADNHLTPLGLATFNETGEALRAMAVAKALSLLLSERSEPRSVFWGPSTFLLDIQKFRRLASSENPLLLYLHCHVYTKDDPETGQKLSGVISSGAQWLVGSTAEIKPTSLPAEYLVEKVYDFVAHSLKSGKAADDGSVFGRDENEKIKVIASTTDGNAADRVELKVIFNSEFGITREKTSGTEAATASVIEMADDQQFNEEKEEPELDPNDPVDAAIIERLAEIEAEASEADEAETAVAETEVSPEPVSIAEATEPETPVSVTLENANAAPEAVSEPQVVAEPKIAVEPAQVSPAEEPRPVRAAKPSSKRMTMAELRDFAKEAQVPQADRDVDTKKRGLIGKIFNRKSG